MAIHIIKFTLQSIGYLLLTIVVTLLSYVVFPIAYLFRSKIDTGAPHEARIKGMIYSHELWKLPDWAYWFDNARSDNPPDGLYGDHNGNNRQWRIDTKDIEPHHPQPRFGTSFKDAWWFSVSRNNINGFKRIFLGVKEIKSVEVLAGKIGPVETSRDPKYHGWHFLKGKTEKGTRYMFHMYRPTASRIYYVKIGWKLSVMDVVRSDGFTYPRGFTFRYRIIDRATGKPAWEHKVSLVVLFAPVLYGLWRLF